MTQPFETAPTPSENSALSTHIAQAVSDINALKAQIARAVIGQQTVVHQLLACLLAGGHVLLEGVPGLGKTLLVKALAQAMTGQFGRVQPVGWALVRNPTSSKLKLLGGTEV